jgi:signal transduction histidine kinase
MYALLISDKWDRLSCNLFISTVKVKKSNKNKIIMGPATSPDLLHYQFDKEMVQQYNMPEQIYCQTIENAGGVPYQLIFGTEIGTGWYRNIGFGVKSLFDIQPFEFTEMVYQRMIEKINPLSADIPSDPSETRKRIMNRQIQNYNAELLIRSSNGVKKWIKDSAVPLVDDKTGKVIGLNGILFDISEQKQIYYDLERARDKATESDRLKTAFLNNLSHEIRTPLNAIVGFTTLLGESANFAESRMEFMDIITHSSDHLLEIVDDIVEISKIEAKIVRVTYKEININDMLQRLFDRFKPLADEKNIILKYNPKICDEEIIVVTDGYKLFQSLKNLISNAIKFTREGQVEFGFCLLDKIQFYVSDTGIGIGKEHQLNIFSSFYQVESSSTQRYDGTGLGLTIARAYIELLGGKIWFSSEPGKGSLFSFNIPDSRQ